MDIIILPRSRRGRVIQKMAVRYNRGRACNDYEARKQFLERAMVAWIGKGEQFQADAKEYHRQCKERARKRSRNRKRQEIKRLLAAAADTRTDLFT